MIRLLADARRLQRRCLRTIQLACQCVGESTTDVDFPIQEGVPDAINIVGMDSGTPGPIAFGQAVHQPGGQFGIFADLEIEQSGSNPCRSHSMTT